ncbi:MAG: 1-deoxy-D-xylulose-5-phosphate reductoisomerase [Deltaproteobacteria bacterium CG11_big_fil_rev_8_21_14_0_20_49_13]|nr:MAG: 1-deoxy-D-xylulose-5-phosphate reductoisomerase [Deltaproteobacteria bacterium CG11_big_fil_rev_8_21_14_0_20_49_13]
MKKLAILGSTGSIGISTLDVVARNPDKFCVVSLAEGHDPVKLFEQINKFRPKIVSVHDKEAADKLKSLGPIDCKVLFGIEGACEVATYPDANLVVSAIVGAVGLKPTYKAIEAGKNVALANKETLVAAGPVVMKKVASMGVKLIPIDSEHSALFQSLIGHNHKEVRRMILTASGGPFRAYTLEQLKNVTLEQALKHPNWSMGAKITIDSASMMNKGLEVIEARWLFDMPVEKIEAVIHPQSIVHSMVEYIDGAVVAQMALPDMRGPIAYALAYPDRVESGVEFLDLTKFEKLTFTKPDLEKFRCLKLAYNAAKAGGSAPCVLNAANEVAVSAFLDKKISFLDIPRIVEEVLNKDRPQEFSSLDDVFATDKWARTEASEVI